MADIRDIAFSLKSASVAKAITEMGWFQNNNEVAEFAAAYAIKNYFDEFDPESYILTDTMGLNYSYSTFDNDGRWSSIIKILYPLTDTPYRYLRSIMNYGLEKIGQVIDEGGNFNITELL